MFPSVQKNMLSPEVLHLCSGPVCRSLSIPWPAQGSKRFLPLRLRCWRMLGHWITGVFNHTWPILSRYLVWKNVPYIFIGTRNLLINRFSTSRRGFSHRWKLWQCSCWEVMADYDASSMRDARSGLVEGTLFFMIMTTFMEKYGCVLMTQRPVQINGFSTTPTGTVNFWLVWGYGSKGDLYHIYI